MSEKIYACLLRLFPAGFREAHGEEALQLFRDRARHETGFLLRVRLWFDLLADLVISIPREYHRAQPALIGAAHQHLDGAPTFFVLGNESPRAGALVSGCVLSLAALSMFSILLGRLGSYRPQRASVAQQQSAGDAQRSTARVGAQRSGGTGENARLGTSPVRQFPAPGAAGSGQYYERRDASQPNPPARENAQILEAQSQPARDPNTIVVRPADPNLDPTERRRVTDAVANNIRAHYFDPGVGRKMAETLLEREKRGDYNVVTDGDAFARLLTRQMRDVSQDKHLEVVYSENRLPERPLAPTPDVMARYREELQQGNCTFEKVEILPHNIGYLKLNSFPDPAICQSTAKAAMASLNHADAIIFDLRDNRGGFAGMVLLISSYLFDHPEYMYDPRFAPTPESWTSSPVPGNQLADKPVYVLTSSTTISAAEQFCYDLKMLKRATLVGETTHGSAHSGVWYRIDDHFGMGVPETKTINPYAKSDWEGIGVEPDVRVQPGDALVTSEKLAENKLRQK
ncbi:MAG TPA: S41 family peptidase [Candidatus Acidoferrum sp.]|jgi:hypothetical protein